MVLLSRLYFAFFFLFMLLACSEDTNPGNGSEGSEDLFGWRTSGLETDPNLRSEVGAGLLEITHVGKHIFVMNARVSEQSTKTKDYQIFTTLQGDTIWDTLSIPNGVSPYSVFADSQFLYVGTDTLGQVWKYNPYQQQWDSISTGLDHQYQIAGIGKYKDKLVLSAASQNVKSYKLPLLVQENDSVWKETRPKITVHDSVQPTFLKFREFDGDLYAASWGNGLWRFSFSDSSWIRLPYPQFYAVNSSGDDADRPRAMAIHKGELYVGYLSTGIHKLKPDKNSWEMVDSAKVVDGRINSNTQYYVYEMVSSGDYLFCTGDSPSLPKVYMGDHGEAKGWRKVSRDSWCSDYSCMGSDAYGIDIIGDTLYVPTWERLVKFPLSDLDSGIAGVDSYYGLEE